MDKRLMVSGYGHIVGRVHYEANSAKFSLQAGANRFFITTVGSNPIIRQAQNSGEAVFVVGRLFSFLHQACGNHHAGIDAMILLPAAADTPIFQLIEAQTHQRAVNGHKTPELA